MSLNRIVVTANAVATPRFKPTEDTSEKIVRFRIAVDRHINKKTARPGTPTADFFTVIARGHVAELVVTSVTKGQLLRVEGRLISCERLHKKTETMCTTIEIVADSVDVIGLLSSAAATEKPSAASAIAA